MKLIRVVEGLVQKFWHEHARPSSNQNDMLKLRRGSSDYKPQINTFLTCHRQKYMRESRMRTRSWTVAKYISRDENVSMFEYALTITHVIVDMT
jgi:hypothetical protein